MLILRIPSYYLFSGVYITDLSTDVVHLWFHNQTGVTPFVSPTAKGLTHTAVPAVPIKAVPPFAATVQSFICPTFNERLVTVNYVHVNLINFWMTESAEYC